MSLIWQILVVGISGTLISFLMLKIWNYFFWGKLTGINIELLLFSCPAACVGGFCGIILLDVLKINNQWGVWLLSIFIASAAGFSGGMQSSVANKNNKND